MNSRNLLLAGGASIICLGVFFTWYFFSLCKDQDVTHIFSPAEGISTPIPTLGVVQSRFISISPAALNKQIIYPGELLILPLFDNQKIYLLINSHDVQIKPNEQNLHILKGIIDGDTNSIVVGTIKSEALFLTITSAQHRYRIVPVDPPLHRLDQLENNSNNNFIFD